MTVCACVLSVCVLSVCVLSVCVLSVLSVCVLSVCVIEQVMNDGQSNHLFLLPFGRVASR